jgi:hypothetical protein
MNYQRIIQTLARDPKLSKIREIILELVGIITHQNIEKLISGKQASDGAKQHLDRIRELMKAQGIPTILNNRDFYNKIIQPAYMKMIQTGG